MSKDKDKPKGQVIKRSKAVRAAIQRKSKAAFILGEEGELFFRTRKTTTPKGTKESGPTPDIGPQDFRRAAQIFKEAQEHKKVKEREQKAERNKQLAMKKIKKSKLG